MSEKKLAHEWDITIDAEFAAVNRPLAPAERDLLEHDLVSGGCRDPLVVWHTEGKLILLDGHHRLATCESFGVPFDLIAVTIASRSQAIEWIKTNQRARRNCTAEELGYRIGKQYDSERAAHGGDRRSESSAHDAQLDGTASSAHDAHLQGTTAERVGDEFGIDAATVRRNAAFARAADAVAESAGHDALAAILAGELGSKKDIERLARLPPDEQREAVAGGKAAVKAAAKQVARRAPKKKPEPAAPEPRRLDLAGVKLAFLALSEDDRMAFLDWIDHELIETTTAGYSS